MNTQPKIIVLDDDPTGSQTVHSCLLLTQWDVETLRLGLREEIPIFFVLTNTRSLTPDQADATTRIVCQNLKQALEAENISDFLVVSRSDSTLRGHYPIETDAIAEQLGPFDAHFLVPAFFEGGRITKNSTHYLIIDGIPTPVHETEFAKDSVFGYQYSYLPDYVEEKTKGRIPATEVECFLLADFRSPETSKNNSLRERLMQLSGNRCCAVDAEIQADLDCFATEAIAAASQGKRFLFRSAASLLTSLANLGPQPVFPTDMGQFVRDAKPGAIIVGSHVKKTTEQLEQLLLETSVTGIEIDVSHLLEDSATLRETLLKTILADVHQAHQSGKTPVVYTSRQELAFPDVQTRLKFGEEVSNLLMDVVRGLPQDIGFLISKGGITSNDVLSNGLALTSARLLGQIIAGCSMVQTPKNHPLFPNLPVVLFPGNVGDADGLVTVYHRLIQAK